MLKSTGLFKRALKRGISYHHAGLDNKKRSVVEMLFREKYLQVRYLQKFGRSVYFNILFCLTLFITWKVGGGGDRKSLRP